jgi:murein DD-endopeptidase MepM/ murein hydrolase activator NlpD
MNCYFCPGLKNLYWKYLTALLLMAPLFASAQIENTEDEPVDFESTELNESQVGGANDEEVNELPLFNESSAGLVLNSVKDSLTHIPAYDMYCGWDTRTLFAQKSAQENLGKGVHFQLCRSDCDFSFPANGNLTSPFGPRWGRMHNGLDLDLETGDNVHAAFEGLVRISQYHSSYGNVVVVRHNNGLETLYAHLSQRKVKPGDHVESGDIIGLGGNTGRSYGSHLHFEIRYMGDAIDPNLIIDPATKSLRDWEFVLNKKHFEYKSIDPKAIEARKTSKKYHTVRKGETLSVIARKHKTSVSAICKLNKIKQNSILRPGQKIRY